MYCICSFNFSINLQLNNLAVTKLEFIYFQYEWKFFKKSYIQKLVRLKTILLYIASKYCKFKIWVLSIFCHNMIAIYFESIWFAVFIYTTVLVSYSKQWYLNLFTNLCTFIHTTEKSCYLNDEKRGRSGGRAAAERLPSLYGKLLLQFSR